MTPTQSLTEYPINGAQLARKHHVNQRSLRAQMRAHPELTPDHVPGEHYVIDRDTEREIMSHPAIRGLPRST
jgi:hypothetical protein